MPAALTNTARKGKPIPRRELYRTITAGHFNADTLQDMDNELSEIKNGARRFNRFPKEICSGMLAGGKELARASLVCRADEITGTQKPRGSYEAEKECGARQEKLLQQYAEAADCWYEIGNFDETQLISSGGESEVYRYDKETVVKINTIRYTVSPQLLLDRIAIHNTMFPSTKMEVLGFGRNEFNEFCVIYTQPFVEGTAPTREMIDRLLEETSEATATEYTKDGHNYKTDWYLFDDLHEENIIVDKYSGKMMVIDSDIRFNIPQYGLGGKYIIPDVRQDFLTDNINTKNEMTQKNDIKDSRNNVQLQGLISGCTVTDTDNGRTTAMLEICTMTKGKSENGNTVFSNPLYHHVAVTANRQSAKAKMLREAEARCKNKENRTTPITISGQLTTDKNGSPFIMTKEEDIEFQSRKSFRNQIQLTGEFVQSTFNDAYASAIVQCSDSTGTKFAIPLIISRNDNPEKWTELSTGQMKPGDTISVTGPLISRIYSDGTKQIFRCSVNTRNYEVLNRTLKTKETASVRHKI